MGTNYYFYPNGQGNCECCGGALPKLHVGKKSAGWVFNLHGYDESGVKDWRGWKTFIKRAMTKNPKAVIVSEYGETLTLDALERIVMKPDRWFKTDEEGIAASDKSPSGCGRYDKKLGLLRADTTPVSRAPYDIWFYDFL